MARKPKEHPVADLTWTPPPAEATKQDAGTGSGEQDVKQAETGRSGETRASNVTLPVETWEWVDAKHAEARSNGGRAFRKSAIIKAVFTLVESVPVDLSGAQSEEEIAERLVAAIVAAQEK